MNPFIDIQILFIRETGTVRSKHELSNEELVRQDRLRESLYDAVDLLIYREPKYYSLTLIAKCDGRLPL